jgi:hypothetical protein
MRRTLVEINFSLEVNMAAKTVDEWCDKNLIINDERRDILRACWIAAQNAEVEKFTSTNSDYMAALQGILCYYHNATLDKQCIAIIMERFKQGLNALKAEHCT